MSNPFANAFKGIKSAPPSFGGNYVQPGKHLFEVKACKMVKSAQRSGADMFVAEILTLESSAEESPPGSTRSYVINFQHPSALSNMKSFAMAAFNLGEHDVDEDVCAALVSDEQPAKGVVLSCEANQVPTRKGGVFTKCLWGFVSEPVAA